MGNINGNLTEREKEILILIAEGMKNHDIADKLFISSLTVGTHKAHIMKKLNLKCTAELTCFAVSNKVDFEKQGKQLQFN
jgi:two-component system, NarL family, nitrate/nitrite response regulator NarL